MCADFCNIFQLLFVEGVSLQEKQQYLLFAQMPDMMYVYVYLTVISEGHVKYDCRLSETKVEASLDIVVES